MDEFVPKIYKFNRIDSVNPLGQWEDVTEELFMWTAEYIDGTSLKQFDDATSLFHSMREIDTKQLRALHVSSRYYSQTYTILTPFEYYDLIIKHHRTRLSIGAADDSGWFTILEVGYTIPATGKSWLLLIYPDGQCVMTDDFNKVSIE